MPSTIKTEAKCFDIYRLALWLPVSPDVFEGRPLVVSEHCSAVLRSTTPSIPPLYNNAYVSFHAHAFIFFGYSPTETAADENYPVLLVEIQAARGGGARWRTVAIQFCPFP